MNDTELVQALLRGDEDAQESLYRDYKKRLYATACHFLGVNDSEAEDAVHEAFIAALEGLAKFEGRSSFYTWLNHICVNCCYSRIRKRKRQAATDAADIELMLRAKSQELALAGEERLGNDERLGKLKAWFARLGGNCAEILGLRFSQGLSMNEIKEKLRVPLGTVASRLARCQQALKRIAEREA